MSEPTLEECIEWAERWSRRIDRDAADRHQGLHILAHLRRIAALEAENARLRAVAANNAALRHALTLALEYWSHRQQRYKNRHPAWVVAGRAALEGQNR